MSDISPNVSEISPNVSENSPNVSEISPNVSEISPNVSEIWCKKLSLGEGFGGFRPQIRILHEISSLELAPNLRNPESCSKYEGIHFSNFFRVLKFQIFHKQKLRFSNESESKNSFSRSRCVGSEPGIHENLAQLEMSTIRNELSVVMFSKWFGLSTALRCSW